MSELRELLEKATPGKWSVCRDSFGLIKSDYKEGTKHERRYPMVGGDREANAALIVHLRNNAETYDKQADRIAELEAEVAFTKDSLKCTSDALDNMEDENATLRARLDEVVSGWRQIALGATKKTIKETEFRTTLNVCANELKAALQGDGGEG